MMQFDMENGDSYIGELVSEHGDVVTLRNYSAWYEGDARPCDSKYVDDEVSFRVTNKTRAYKA